MVLGNWSKAYDAYRQALYDPYFSVPQLTASRVVDGRRGCSLILDVRSHRDEKNPTFWCSFGVLLFQLSQYHEALNAYSRAIRLNPGLSEVWYNLGVLYESCQQTTDAIHSYIKGAELDPQNLNIQTRLKALSESKEMPSAAVAAARKEPEARMSAAPAPSAAVAAAPLPGSLIVGPPPSASAVGKEVADGAQASVVISERDGGGAAMPHS